MDQKLKNKVYQLQGRINAVTERLSKLPVEMFQDDVSKAITSHQKYQKTLNVLVCDVLDFDKA